ncbi:hypothetical protein Tco_1471667, partial [Tanacetum coccineum]
MEDIEWDKVEITDEVMAYVIPKYGKCNWYEDNSWSDIILKDIYDTFYIDEAKAVEEAKLPKKSEDVALSIMKDTKMKNFDWGKEKTTDEIMGQVMAKYGRYNLLEDDSWGDIILDDIIYKFYRDELEETEVGKENDKGKGKVDDKGKGKMDDKGKGIMDDVHSRVDRLEKGNSKVMVCEKGTKKANVNLVDVLDLQNRIKKLSDDFN